MLGLMRARGGSATRSTLVTALGVSQSTASRALDSLVNRGLVVRSRKGSYRLAGDSGASLPRSAAEIVAALQHSGVEAHLTGMDLIAAHGHQFVRGFPHLVYADPDALEQVAFALSQAGFLPVPPGRHVRNLLAHSPDIDRVVVLRGQTPARMARFGVRSEIAPPEKAWLDLLRETRAGNVPSSLADLGAILTALVMQVGDRHRLRRWAREMGYEEFVDAVLGDDVDLVDPALREIRAGAAR